MDGLLSPSLCQVSFSSFFPSSINRKGKKEEEEEEEEEEKRPYTAFSLLFA
jgi:hypothetical protein